MTAGPIATPSPLTAEQPQIAKKKRKSRKAAAGGKKSYNERVYATKLGEKPGEWYKMSREDFDKLKDDAKRR